MKKIETDSIYEYSRLFDAVIDTNKLSSETVGRDKFGNLILHISETYNIGNAYSTSDEFYILTAEEYREYLGKARENKLISFFEYRKFLRGCTDSAAKITSFEEVTLHESGMRFTVDYEIVMKDGEAEVSEYVMNYSGGKPERVLQRRAVCGADAVLAVLNSCKLLSWDGFHGKHPRGVLDGTMFSLKATVNGDSSIIADGSQNFPKHYREFRDWLYMILDQKE